MTHENETRIGMSIPDLVLLILLLLCIFVIGFATGLYVGRSPVTINNITKNMTTPQKKSDADGWAAGIEREVDQKPVIIK